MAGYGFKQTQQKGGPIEMDNEALDLSVNKPPRQPGEAVSDIG